MKIVFFTGAGISAESGISTFRDSNGLWENHKVDEVCNIFKWREYKELVFDFYSKRRKQLAEVKPNEIHYSIAEIQKKLGKENVVVITQNIDDLLERAGCEDVLHVHGFLTEMKCMNKECGHIWDVGYSENSSDMVCPKCSGEVKPNVVFFGEEALNYHFMKRHFYSVDKDGYFIVMGTMGNVVPVDRYLPFIEGKKILNNLEENMYINSASFNYSFFEKGSSAIKKIKDIIFS